MTQAMYPLTFEPVYRDYMWGGRRLATLLGRDIPPGTVAESWEISGHPSSPTMVAAGPLRGLSLPQVLERFGSDLVGAHSADMLMRGAFPLLVKILDAREDLSVQVHPDDAYACAHEGGELGKTEMWYILYAEPGAELIHGLRPGVTPGSFRAALRDGCLPTQLRTVQVRPGDAVFVPSGTVHALRSGIMTVEIQQNSDTTYRVYDWDRVGADGKPRELHVDRALEVIAFGPQPEALVRPVLRRKPGGVRVESLVSCDKFDVERVTLADGAVYDGCCTGDTFEIWGAVDGRARLEPGADGRWPVGALSLQRVSWALLPAALGPYRLLSEGACTLLRAYVPPQE